MKRIFILFFLFIFQILFFVKGLLAQEKKENVFLHPDKFYQKFFPHFKIKHVPVDSLYITAYPKYLSISVHLLDPKIYLDLDPTGSKGVGKQASSRFRTNVNTIVGFSGSYRFVTAGFAVALKTNPEKSTDYAHTKYRTATINYNSPKYSLQFKFIKLGGMTDVNELNNQDTTRKYTPRKDITMKEYRFEGIYNFGWKKYSYIAPIDFTQRQVKSRIGFLLKAGIYNNQLFSDSNLLSQRQRPYFEGFDNITKMISYSVKLAPGVGGNFVFMKRFYLSTSIFIPYNLYFLRLYTSDGHLERKEASVQFVLDGIVSVGYQSKRLYAGIRYQADSKGAKMKYVSLTTVYSYVGFDIGYRFHTPKIVKKVYKKTMPPGM
jgi:hypothetical protein